MAGIGRDDIEFLRSFDDPEVRKRLYAEMLANAEARRAAEAEAARASAEESEAERAREYAEYARQAVERRARIAAGGEPLPGGPAGGRRPSPDMPGLPVSEERPALSGGSVIARALADPIEAEQARMAAQAEADALARARMESRERSRGKRAARGSEPYVSVLPDAGAVRFLLPPLYDDEGNVTAEGFDRTASYGPELYRYLYGGGLDADLASRFDWTPGGGVAPKYYAPDQKVLDAIGHRDWTQVAGPQDTEPTWLPWVQYPEDWPDRSLAGKRLWGQGAKWRAVRSGLPFEPGARTVTWNGREIANPFGSKAVYDRLQVPYYNYNHPVWEKDIGAVEANPDLYRKPLLATEAFELDDEGDPVMEDVLGTGEMRPKRRLGRDGNPAKELVIPEGWDPGVAPRYAGPNGKLAKTAAGNDKKFDYLADARRRQRDIERRYSGKERTTAEDVLLGMASRLTGEGGEAAGEALLDGLRARKLAREIREASGPTSGTASYDARSPNVPKITERYDDGADDGRDLEKEFQDVLRLLQSRGTEAEKDFLKNLTDIYKSNGYEGDLKDLLRRGEVTVNGDGTFTVNLNDDKIYDRATDDEGNPVGSTSRKAQRDWGSHERPRELVRSVLRKRGGDGEVHLESVQVSPRSIRQKNKDEYEETRAKRNAEAIEGARGATAAELEADEKARAEETAAMLEGMSAEEKRAYAREMLQREASRRNFRTQGADYRVVKDSLGNDVLRSGGARFKERKDFVRNMFSPRNSATLDRYGIGAGEKQAFIDWLDGDYSRWDDAAPLKGAEKADRLAAAYADARNRGMGGTAGHIASALKDAL